MQCHFCTLYFAILTLAATITSLPLGVSDYSSVSVKCPSGTLVRPATGLGKREKVYRMKRKVIADEALMDWWNELDLNLGL